MHSPLHRREFLATLGALLIASGCGGSRHQQGMTYQVQPGDSLSSLSHRSGIPISVIVAHNGLRSRHLEPGMRLYLPGISELPLTACPDQDAPCLAHGGYTFVPRSQWGAEPLRLNHDPMLGISAITLHHTAEVPGMGHLQDGELMRTMQAVHQEKKGWADIGYHFVVGRDGEVYEGRPLNAQGAHVKDRNEHNLGISVIGNYDTTRPSAKQIQVIGTLIDEQKAKYRVPAKRVWAHRELGNTVCPGRHLFAWLEEFRLRSQA